MNGIFVSDEHLISFGTNNSTPDGKPILACFIEASKTRDVMNENEEEIRQLIISSIGSLFSPYIAAGVPEPETVYIANWASEKWSRGAYATVMAPGVWTGFQIPFGQSINRIHFAGTETTDKTYAYLDGAIRSGKRVAKEIIG